MSRQKQEIPIKGNGLSQDLEITLHSGVWNSNTDINTEQLATVKVSGITQNWQVKTITMTQFATANNAINLDDIRSIQIRDNSGGMAGSIFWLGDFTFYGGFNPATAVPPQNWLVNVSTYNTWCYGDIVKGTGDSMPVDATVKYFDNNTGRLEFTSNSQGTARFLGFPHVRMSSSVDSAYIEIPIKGNGVTSVIEMSMVSNNNSAGSWIMITGITNEWQVKRIYLKDFYTYMGVPNFDNINYLDFYARNSQGAKFWIGNFVFRTSDEHPIPLKHKTDITQTITWAYGSIQKNYIPIDNIIRHNGRSTARIKFIEDSRDNNAVFFIDPEVVKMADNANSGYIIIPIKGNNISDKLKITIASGVWNGNTNLNTEQTATVTLHNLNDKWQTKKITMQEFLAINPEINLDDITSVRISGTQGGIENAVFWIGDMSFASREDNKMIVQITPNDDVLLNPGMGWILLDTALPGFSDLGISGKYPLVQNVGIMTTWGNLEPENGVYDFSRVDDTIDYWTSIGKKIHFRISTDDFPYYGNRLPGCPDWLYALGVSYQNFTYPDEQIPLKYPDLNNSTYQFYLNRFMEEFGSRYRENPNVTVVGLRGYGLWGEWHSGYAFNNWEERKSGLRAVIDAWVAGFKGKKHLSLNYSHSPFNNTKDKRYPQNLAEFMEYNALDYALNFEEIGFEREGAYGAIRYPQWVFNALTFNMGKMQIAEIAGSYSGDLKNRHLQDGIDHPELALEECLNLRPNYITIFGWDKQGNAKLFYDERRDLIEHGLKNMGYRLYPATTFYDYKVEPGKSFNLTQEWKNLAVGRFFEDGKVKISVVDPLGNEITSKLVSQFELVDITREESKNLDISIEIPESTPDGMYSIKVSIINSSGESIIEMAMDDKDFQGRYYIGDINVTNYKIAEISPTILPTISINPYPSIGIGTDSPLDIIDSLTPISTAKPTIDIISDTASCDVIGETPPDGSKYLILSMSIIIALGSIFIIKNLTKKQ